MKLEELQKITDEKQEGIRRWLSLGRVRSRQAVNGLAPGMAAPVVKTNRAALRAAKYHRGENSAFGHIYSGTVDPAEVARRRKANRAARKARALQRKQG